MLYIAILTWISIDHNQCILHVIIDNASTLAHIVFIDTMRTHTARTVLKTMQDTTW